MSFTSQFMAKIKIYYWDFQNNLPFNSKILNVFENSP